MKKQFCEYCGKPLSEGCDCARYAQEEQERYIDEYESRPDVCYGWHQQDLIDMRRRER